ncbi:hypothetical protein [Embleya sp. NPDC059237]|uniref:hypothetical protein n=1 Tax=Embleya sp. NPDC059237 TaxID=3346784 RepID=UPI00367D8C94
MDTPDVSFRPGSAEDARAHDLPHPATPTTMPGRTRIPSPRLAVGAPGTPAPRPSATPDNGGALLFPLLVLAAVIGGIYLVGRNPPQALSEDGDEHPAHPHRGRIAEPEHHRPATLGTPFALGPTPTPARP